MMETRLRTQQKAAPVPSFTPVCGGLLQRKCACGGTPGPSGECDACRKTRLQRRSENLDLSSISHPPSSVSEVPPIVHEVLRSPGQPLDVQTREFMEPRFGHDFSNVRIHTNAVAAESAKAVNARAYTVGQNIAFGSGQCDSTTAQGRRLLAHELAHTTQQRTVSRPIATMLDVSPATDVAEVEAECTADAVVRGKIPALSLGRSHSGYEILSKQTAKKEVEQSGASTEQIQESDTKPVVTVATDKGNVVVLVNNIPVLEIRLPPGGGEVNVTSTWDAGTNTLKLKIVIPQGAETQTPDSVDQTRTLPELLLEITDSTSAESGLAFEHDQAERTLSLPPISDREFKKKSKPRKISPSPDSMKLEKTAKSDKAGLTEPSPTRNEKIGETHSPLTDRNAGEAQPKDNVKPKPACFPKSLGARVEPSPANSNRTNPACGSGDDWDSFDYPPKVPSTASSLRMLGWAFLHGRHHRSSVTDTECMLEMGGVLNLTSSSAGVAAFVRFISGIGGKETINATEELGALALNSPSFLATLASVQTAIEWQLAAQAAVGALDPCALSSLSPLLQTEFPLFGPDPLPLQAVIGGTHGEELWVTGFDGKITTRNYSISLRFLICDNFGVDETDLYAPGLIPFWILQHERSPTLYKPFINELDLGVTISGTF